MYTKTTHLDLRLILRITNKLNIDVSNVYYKCTGKEVIDNGGGLRRKQDLNCNTKILIIQRILIQ
jgi:hypothetical protein